MLYRLKLLDKISEEDRNTILRVVDAFLKEAQLTTTTQKIKSIKYNSRRYRLRLLYFIVSYLLTSAKCFN